MKNVLFTTTALAAFAVAGSAFAAGHGDNFTLTGSTDVGYNDEIEGGIFQETNIDLKASRDAGNGFMVGGHVRLNLDWYEGGAEFDSGVNEVEFKSIYVETPVGKLEYADSFDGTGASDSFYKDRDGMAEDMSNGDGHAGLKWSGDMGQFGYAIDMGNLSADSDDNTGDHYTIGLGGSFGAATVGFGWENNAHDGAGTDQVLGASVDFSAGIVDVGLSYIDSAVETSSAIAVAAEVTPGLTVGAYYAMNDVALDEFGVLVDYENGPFAVGLDYHTGASGFDDNIEVDVSYAVNNYVTLYAGYDENELNFDKQAGSYYLGAEIMVADGIDATIAWADADEIGGPEFKRGASAFLSLTY